MDPKSEVNGNTHHRNWLARQLQDNIDTLRKLETQLPVIERAAGQIAEALHQNGQVFFFGNGGSAADAQHLAAELSGRFYQDRRPLAATALTTNSSAVTAIANDYGYEEIFQRQLQGMAEPGDIAVGISTSGESENVIRALTFAQQNDIVTVGLTGAGGGSMTALSNYWIEVPATDVARVQEGHILCGHLLCGLVERRLFGSSE